MTKSRIAKIRDKNKRLWLEYWNIQEELSSLDGDGKYMTQNTNEVLIGASDFRDFYMINFTKDRIMKGISTVTQRIECRGNHKRAMEYIRECYSSFDMFSPGEDRILINKGDVIVEIEINSNTIDFMIHSTLDGIDAEKKLILEHFEEIVVKVSWIYDTHMNSISVPVDDELVPVDEMYPFLDGEDLPTYYRRFMDSSASILILIGPPGTGKTSFIRGYLSDTESSAMVTYDEKILANDSLFSEFVSSEYSVLVIEDADMFLSSRKDGNAMMHKFLNVGDGLVTVKGKKIIFSTNLPSIKDIDEALLRPGRCYDILKFGSLNRSEAEKLAVKVSVPFTFPEDIEEVTIAEVFSGKRNSGVAKAKRSFGFSKN